MAVYEVDSLSITQGENTYNIHTGSGGAGIFTVEGTITNTSGSYTGTFQDQRITAGMKAIYCEFGTPSVFDDDITVTTAAGSVTITCNSVAGTSTFKIGFIGSVVTSTEYEALDGAKADKVANAVNNSFAGLDSNGNLTDSCLSVVNGKLCITYQKEVDD